MVEKSRDHSDIPSFFFKDFGSHSPLAGQEGYPNSWMIFGVIIFGQFFGQSSGHFSKLI